MKRRLFVAIDVAAETKSEFQHLAKKLSRIYPVIRSEKEHKFHLTLKFLGQTVVEPETILSAIKQKLDGFSSFRMNFGTLGVIINKAAVVIVEVDKSEELMRLFHMIDNCLYEIGFRRERRSFHPHITIGRVREAETKKLFLVAHQKMKLAPVLVEKVTLIESKLTYLGAVHTRVGTVPLVQSRGSDRPLTSGFTHPLMNNNPFTKADKT